MSEKKGHTLADDIERSGYEMADELKVALGGAEEAVEAEASVHAFGSISEEPDEAAEEEDPTQTEFFRAMNAFRAAKHSGDKAQMDAAEAHLREVVRAELTGSEDCGCE